jgi:transposase
VAVKKWYKMVVENGTVNQYIYSKLQLEIKMIGEQMYHTILTLRKYGDSQREIAKQLRLSKTTVNKYCNMHQREDAANSCQRAGRSEFAVAEDFVRNLLCEKPKLRASSLYDAVKNKYPLIKSKQRAFRSFVKPIREQLFDSNKFRKFSIIETEAGKQVQVDPGEMKVDGYSNTSFKVYFTCFTLSYSRYTYVHFQLRPYCTSDFIQAHKQAFIYFEGIPEECVYDQTKLVVIQEKFGEVFFNEQFHHFARQTGFHPHVCKKRDPQSKGKVERTIQEVKRGFLYPRYFSDIADVRSQGYAWLSIFNDRTHATTQKKPSDLWRLEKIKFLSIPESLVAPDLRNADKTGLISYQGNKYSVPSKYQRKQVIVQERDEYLIICDQVTFDVISKHLVAPGKGNIVKSNNHYRDYSVECEELINNTIESMNKYFQGEALVRKIVLDNPRIIRDQIRALNKLLNNYEEKIWIDAIPKIMDHHPIKVSLIDTILKKSEQSFRLLEITGKEKTSDPQGSVIQRSLNDYMRVLKDA